MTLKYLGANITRDRNLEEEVQEQTTKAVVIFGDIIWKNKYMRLRSKIRMYETRARSVMTPVIETRAKTNIIKLSRTTEMRTLRCITDGTLYGIESVTKVRDSR